MGLLQKLKSTLGLGSSRNRRDDRRTGEGGVRVEHEPDARSEAAVKGSGGWDDEPAGGATTGSEDGGERSAGAGDEAPGDAAGASEETTEAGADQGVTAAGEGVPVDELNGIGSAYAERLGNAGIESVADLAEADAATLDDETDVGQGRLEGWIEQAKGY